MVDFMAGKVFSKTPFAKEGSYQLIEAAKFGKIDLIVELLERNPYLVYDFDYVRIFCGQ